MPSAYNQGVRIYYEIEGQGEPLVLHHGTGDCLASWRAYGYAAVLRRNYQLIMIDGRGHGRSDRPHDPAAYTLDQRVGDVIAVLDDLGIAQAHHFGLSGGGWTVLGIARYARERAQSLIIGGAQPYGESLAVFRELFASGITTWLGTIEQMAGHQLPQRMLLLEHDLQALQASVAEERPDISAELMQLEAPCLLFAGDADPRYPLVARCAAELPAASFVGLPGLNHVQAIVQSERVLPHLQAFLTAVRISQASVVVD